MDADAQLMLEFQQGNRKAFEALFRRHAKKMVTFAYRYVNDRAAAEELAQDIFCKVFESAHGYNPTAKFTTWLFRVATNHCLNEVRKGRYKVFSVSAETGGRDADGAPAEIGLADAAPGPLDQAVQGELERDVQRCLQTLPENQRLAMTLLVESDQSYEEIAKTLKTSVSAVKSLLVRARATLKEKLQGHLEAEYASRH